MTEPSEPAEPESDPADVAQFRTDVRQAVRYENGLAVKMLIPLALVAALIVVRLLGF
jgi:ureidoglycolate hydrolase